LNSSLIPLIINIKTILARMLQRKPAPKAANVTTIHSLTLMAILLLLVAPQVYFGGMKYPIEHSINEPQITTKVAPAVWDPNVNPLGIPPGKAPNLPSPRLKEDTVKRGGVTAARAMPNTWEGSARSIRAESAPDCSSI
jgi:hypothetical protein